jgi:hypothetical protein
MTNYSFIITDCRKLSGIGMYITCKKNMNENNNYESLKRSDKLITQNNIILHIKDIGYHSNNLYKSEFSFDEINDIYIIIKTNNNVNEGDVINIIYKFINYTLIYL